MEMTQEQRQDYNKLTKSQKEDFDYAKRKHPDWSFTQLMAKVAFEEQTVETIEKGGKNVDPQDPDTWLLILEGVKKTLSRFQSIGQFIFAAIDGAIQTIKGLIWAGVKKVGSIIDNLLDSIF